MTEDALLNTIRLHPDEDTPRLVYADYLDETGDANNAALAEFVRLQVRLSQLPFSDPERLPLEDRENELLRENERKWLGALTPPLARGLLRWKFDRGFVDQIRIDTYTASIHGKKLFDRLPIQRVKLDRMDQGRTPSPPRLAACPWWSRVRELVITETTRADPVIAQHVLSSPYLTNLRSLELDANTNIERANQNTDFVAACPSFNQLHTLTLQNWRGDVAKLVKTLDQSKIHTLALSGTGFTAKTLELLLSSDFAAQAKSVSLKDGNLDADLWSALNSKSAKPVITRLNFTNSRANLNLDLPTLLNARATANLEELDLSETHSPATTVQQLAHTAFMERATAIGLTRCTLTPKVMKELANTDAPQLRRLTLGETGLGDAGVRAMCKAKWADNITHLDIMRNRLSDKALVAMAKSGRFINVRRIDLRVNSPDLDTRRRIRTALGDEGVIALANAPNFARLRALNLYRTRVTPRGIEALFNSPYFHLTELDIGGDYPELEASLVNVIANSPRLARMTRLAISFTPALGEDVLLPLAESPYLSPLCHLDIRYNNVSARVTAILQKRLSRRLENYPTATTW
jgi:uncharacterized protein (TIGR02996 family)